MKRLLEAVLVVWFVGLAAIASAQTLRVTADRTNVRDKPTTDGAIVVAVSKGDELEILDKSGNWYHVRVKSTGAQGYVNALVVEVVQGDAPAARPNPPSTPRPAPTTPPAGGAPAKPAAASPTNTAERTYFIRVFGGLWSGGSTTGVGLGGGVAGRPFGNDQFEVQVDFAYAHQGLNQFVVSGTTYQGSYVTDAGAIGARLFQGSGTLLYNVKLSSQAFTPFVGLGLEYADEAVTNIAQYSGSDRRLLEQATIFGFSGISLQAVVGIEKPINDKRAFRAELRGTAHGVLLLGGLSF